MCIYVTANNIDVERIHNSMLLLIIINYTINRKGNTVIA